jgi:hypothetical protein
VSLEENKDLIRRYVEAIDTNESDSWSILDEYIAGLRCAQPSVSGRHAGP